MIPFKYIIASVFSRTRTEEKQAHHFYIMQSKPSRNNINPWRTSGSSSEQFARIWSGQSCTCVRFQEPKGRLGLDQLKANRLRAIPANYTIMIMQEKNNNLNAANHFRSDSINCPTTRLDNIFKVH